MPVRLATLHALAFLVAGNAAGVLLAAMVVFPAIGEGLAPLTYGRWMPVHLDVLLYGWGSLPLIALLLHAFGAAAHALRPSLMAVHAWSAMVVAGAASWLLGGSSGKAFLDWRGGARDVMVLAMSLLWVALAWCFARGARGRLRALLLAALAPVPFVIAWAARDDVYPAINPDSGGPTGVSLMGSVLGIVALLLLTPVLLGIARRPSRSFRTAIVLLALHAAAFVALLGIVPGNHSHREPIEIAALASVAIWIPALVLALRGMDWPAQARPWLVATAGWGVALAATGIGAFLPGVLERWKFSHALVAHAHVALAGLVTAWSMVVLVTLLRGTPLAASLGSARRAAAWQAALGLHLLALAGLAAIEMRSPGGLLPAGGAANALFVARLVAGSLQAIVSCAWLAAAWRETWSRHAGAREPHEGEAVAA